MWYVAIRETFGLRKEESRAGRFDEVDSPLHRALRESMMMRHPSPRQTLIHQLPDRTHFDSVVAVQVQRRV